MEKRKGNDVRTIAWKIAVASSEEALQKKCAGKIGVKGRESEKKYW